MPFTLLSTAADRTTLFSSWLLRQILIWNSSPPPQHCRTVVISGCSWPLLHLPLTDSTFRKNFLVSLFCIFVAEFLIICGCLFRLKQVYRTKHFQVSKTTFSWHKKKVWLRLSWLCQTFIGDFIIWVFTLFKWTFFHCVVLGNYVKAINACKKKQLKETIEWKHEDE